jgi:cell division protein FtsQ
LRKKKETEAKDALPKNERVEPRDRAVAEAPPKRDRAARLVRIKALASRVVTVGARALLVAAVVVAAVVLGQSLEGFVRTSPAFALGQIEIRGASRLSEAEIIEASEIGLGENVFKWPPEDVEARLAAHPWVSKASVKRKLPARFEIEVREHAPRALLVLDSLYLVSREGVVFKEVSSGEAFDLPIITLEDGDAIRASRARRAALLTEVAALLHDVEAAEPSWATTLAEIHVHADGAFTLRFGEEGTEVRLGQGDLEGKLARLRRVFARLERAGVEASRVYADNERRPDRVTVELR